MDRVDLRHGPFALSVLPGVGGALAGLFWHGQPLLRPQAGPGVLDSGCFALVPFSNRIAGSRFDWAGRDIALMPNHPGRADEPVLHGFGWLRAWDVAAVGADFLSLRLMVAAGDWPWAFEAGQGVRLDDDGVEMWLALTNCSGEPMPAGLGFHPFFPRDAATVYHGLHRGEWRVDAALLPTRLDLRDAPLDWWAGAAVGSRCVDTVYAGRAGVLDIVWPERGMGLAMTPCDDLSFTTVYVPEGGDFFCVEPVSHMTDGFNRARADSGVRVLAPGERWAVSMRLRPYWLGDQKAVMTG